MVQARGVLFCGGGTGGHIFPGLAVAEQCRAAGIDQVSWIGDPDRLEARLVPEAGIPLLAYGLSRPRIKNPFWYLKAFRLLIKTWRHLRKQPPRCVVSSGGYAALLQGILAPLLGRPLVVIEPNARPGKTNRLLALFARLVVIQFADAAHYLQNGNVQQLGNPVRSISVKPRGQEQKLRILVMGGSLSAKSINELIFESLAHLEQHADIEFIHVAGEEAKDQTQAAYDKAGVQAQVHGFVDDMPALYNSVDLAICRSGATSVAELCAAGIGACYIPLPWAADDHQTANARAVARVGGAVVLPQRQIKAAGLARLITRLNNNRSLVRQLGEQSYSLSRPQAALAIWQEMQRFPGASNAVG